MNLRDNHRSENETLIIKGDCNLAIEKKRAAQGFEDKENLGLNSSLITLALPSITTCLYYYLGNFDNISVMNLNPHSLNV